MTSPTCPVDTPRPQTHLVVGPVPGTRPARQHRSGPAAGARSSWGVPAALVVLTLLPVIAGSLRVLEIAGGPHILPANSRIDAVGTAMAASIVLGLTAIRRRDIAAHRAWMIRRPSTRRVRRARTHAAPGGSR